MASVLEEGIADDDDDDDDDDRTRTAAEEELLAPFLASLPATFRGIACTSPLLLLLLLPLIRTRVDGSAVVVVADVADVVADLFGRPSKARNEAQTASADGDGGKVSAIVSAKRIQLSKQWV